MIPGDGRLYAFRPEKLLPALTEKEQEDFLQRAETSMLQVRNHIKELMDRRPALRECASFSFPVTPAAGAAYENRLANPQSDLSLYPFIRTGDAPYIPGSSLKGAIRTACLSYLLNGSGRRVRASDRSDNLQKDVFGYQRINDDPFRYLRIGDSQPFPEATILAMTNVVSVRDGREQIPMMREVSRAALMGGNAPSSEHRSSALPAPAGTRFVPTVEAVIEACRYFYGKHLEQEARRLRELADAKSRYDVLAASEKKLGQDEFLVRLGWGCGFYGVTVAYEMEETPDKSSCRLLEGGVPLGWARVKVKRC